MQGTTQTQTQAKTKACFWNRLFTGTGFVKSVEMSSRIKMLLKFQQIQLTFFFNSKPLDAGEFLHFMHSFNSLRDKVDSALFALSPPRSPLGSIGKPTGNCGFVLHTNWTPVQFGGCASPWNSLFDVAWAVDTGDCFCIRLRTFLLVILSPCIVLCLHFLSHAIEILRQIGFEAVVSSFSLSFLERKIQNFFQTHKLAECQTQLWLKDASVKLGECYQWMEMYSCLGRVTD